MRLIMELNISFFSISATTLFTAFAILLSFLFCLFTLTKRGSHDKKTAPEAKGSRPLLGHLHLLGGPEPPHLVLAKLADLCGPIFTVRLGVHRAIVANTWEIAKECLTTHDRTFATRPKLVSSDVMTYNYAMFGFSPYGPFWRLIRKISTLELLSSHRIELFKHVRESEVQISVKNAYDKWRNKIFQQVAPSTTVLLDMKRWFRDITLNIIFRMIIGKRFSDEEVEDEKTKQAIRVWFELAGRFVVSDGFPFLRWLDIGGHEKAMKRTSEELDRAMQRWLDEHKAKRKLCGEKKIDEDFMDVLLSTLEDNKEALHTFDADTVNKATSMTMILGASDTTTVTMIWALSLLLNHEEFLKKVQQELDTNIGRDRIVKESDLKNLPYLQAVIKETMRLYPAAPLVIHEATEDCSIQGYVVPKGTRLLLNLYKIQRDSRVWTDPNEFNPERFLTTHKDLDVKGQNFEFMPFGSGRRVCPGISLALPVVGLSLASFLQAFEVRIPGNESIDMTESIGMSNLKATPLDVLITPRLPEFVYSL